jgi:hypothetical protein
LASFEAGIANGDEFETPHQIEHELDPQVSASTSHPSLQLRDAPPVLLHPLSLPAFFRFSPAKPIVGQFLARRKSCAQLMGKSVVATAARIEEATSRRTRKFQSYFTTWRLISEKVVQRFDPVAIDRNIPVILTAERRS